MHPPPPLPLHPLHLRLAFELHLSSHQCLPSINSDMTAWDKSAKMGTTLMTKAVGFLQAASGPAAGAVVLRLMDAHAALLPISSLPDDERHTANCALMCLINVLGNQEAQAKGQDSPIMRLRPDVFGVGNAARTCQS